MSQSVAENIGNYDVASRLEAPGREIYTADKDTDSYVLTLFEGSAPLRKSLEAEVRRAMLIDHPSVMVPVDTFAHADRHVLVFPSLEGISLLRAMRLLEAEEQHLSDGAITYLGSVLMKALALAHDAKDAAGKRKALVHAELAPHQVLLPWDEPPKVLGIGMTAVFKAAADNGRQPSWVEPFLAPEVSQGKPVTVRSNAYSAALMLWSLYAHKMPPTEGLLPSLASERPDLPRALSSRIDQTLSPRAYTRTGCSLLAKVFASHVKQADRDALSAELAELKAMVPRNTPVPTESIPPSSFERPKEHAEIEESPETVPASPDGSVKVAQRASQPGSARTSSVPVASSGRGKPPPRRKTRMLSSDALRREPAAKSAAKSGVRSGKQGADPLDKRPTRPEMAAARPSDAPSKPRSSKPSSSATPASGDRVSVSTPMPAKARSLLGLAGGKLPPRRTTLASLPRITSEEEKAAEEAAAPDSVPNTSPGIGEAKRSHPTQMMGAVSDVAAAVEAAKISDAGISNAGAIVDTLDWELAPLVSDEDSMRGSAPEDIDASTDAALAEALQGALVTSPGADGDADADDASDADAADAADAEVSASDGEQASDSAADAPDSGEDIVIGDDAPGGLSEDDLFGDISAPDADDEGDLFDELDAANDGESSADDASLVSTSKSAAALGADADALAAPDSVSLAEESTRSGSGKWIAGGLIVAACVGAGLWFASRGNQTANNTAAGPAGDASAVVAAATANPTDSATAAAPAQPSAEPSAEPDASAAASASAVPSAQAAAGVPAAELPADQGYIQVDTPYHKDTHVYANGKPLGKSGEQLQAKCGKALWIRVGTMPQTRWYGQGRAVRVPCRDSITVMINTAPQARPKTGTDGDIYQ